MEVTVIVYWCPNCDRKIERDWAVAEMLRCPKCDRPMRSNVEIREVKFGKEEGK